MKVSMPHLEKTNIKTRYVFKLAQLLPSSLRPLKFLKEVNYSIVVHRNKV